ncbi:hypothetical protein WCX49_11610 [Sulfurimonas sp. HSL-1656]|uniref:hypothetical protein n=1 Tax=Thiomicrolovo subterrani TaxID=3131934 RepID=UPI0031FA2B45
MQVNNKRAPVLLFAYNRLDHLKSTTQKLLLNKLADQSEIFIFSDAPRQNKDEVKVQEVRSYLRDLSGFKTINIIEREENYGLAKNIIEGVTEIINKYGKVIVLEDDLITSTNFLCYMNSALDYYKDRKDIFAISGYSPNLKSLICYENETYLTYRPSSWGWATWLDQWESIDWDLSDYEDFIKDWKSVRAFNRGGIDMTRMLKHYKEGKNNSWAIRWSYAMYKQGKYAVFAKSSKVQNIGFGSEATHCSNTNIYETVLDTTSKCDFDFTDEILPNSKIAKEFKFQVSYTNKLIKKSIAFLKGFKK